MAAADVVAGFSDSGSDDDDGLVDGEEYSVNPSVAAGTFRSFVRQPKLEYTRTLASTGGAGSAVRLLRGAQSTTSLGSSKASELEGALSYSPSKFSRTGGGTDNPGSMTM